MIAATLCFVFFVLGALAFCLLFVTASPPQFLLIVVFWSSCNQKYIIDGGADGGAPSTALVLDLTWPNGGKLMLTWRLTPKRLHFLQQLVGLKVKLHVACDWENLIST